MNSVVLKRLLPLIFICLAVLAFAALTWLGQGSQHVEQSAQYRPVIAAEFSYSEHDRVQQQAVEDVIYRMRTHHEYRVATQADMPVAATVQIVVSRDNGVIELRAAVINATGEPSGEPEIIVEGPAEVALMLSGKLFSLLNSQLRNLAIIG